MASCTTSIDRSRPGTRVRGGTGASVARADHEGPGWPATRPSPSSLPMGERTAAARLRLRFKQAVMNDRVKSANGGWGGGGSIRLLYCMYAENCLAVSVISVGQITVST